MEVFYLKKDEFLKISDLNSLEKFKDNHNYKSRDKYLEHLCGLFLVKFIAKNVYKVENTEIAKKNGKPYFSSSKLHFSISHSKDIVMVAFNKQNIGLDVECMYPRDYKKILERYGKNIKNPTRHDFYRFWTLHEAEIKLGTEPRAIYSAFLNEDYVYTCVSDSALVIKHNIKKLTFKGSNIDLEKEFEKPQLIQF